MSTSERSRISPFLRQCLVCLSVGCTTLGHGSMSAVTSVMLAQLHEIHGTIITTEHISWATSIIAPSFLIGAIVVCPIMGRLGRKVAHLAVTVPAILGWLMITFANTFTLIMIGRVLQGLSFGMSLPLRSTLIGEYTSPKNRGAFLSTLSLAQGTGVLVVHLIGTFFHWRTTCLLCSLFHVICLVILYFTPESPSWLADKKMFEQCKISFKLLRGNEDNNELDKLIRAKTEVYNTEKIKNLTDVMRVINKKEFYKPVILMLHSYASSDMSGASVVPVYSAIVLPIVVSPNVDVTFTMLMLDINRVISSMFLIYIAEKMRRKILLVSTSGMCIVCYLVFVSFMYMRSIGILTDNVWLPLVLYHVVYMSIVIVLGTPYIIAGEIFPLQYRSIGGSISVISLSITYFTVVKTFPGLVSTVGLQYTYLIYTGVQTYLLIMILLLLPETKGKTLLQIEEEFREQPVEQTTTRNDKIYNEILTPINPSETYVEVCNTEEDFKLRTKFND